MFDNLASREDASRSRDTPERDIGGGYNRAEISLSLSSLAIQLDIFPVISFRPLNSIIVIEVESDPFPLAARVFR